MMETKRILNPLTFAEKHRSIYTGCIHYKNAKENTRDVVPLTENILYGIALVTSLSKEKAERGFLFLERMFAFCTDDGFPGYMHDFPRVYSDKPNVDIFLALSFFLKDYARVIPSVTREKIGSIISKLSLVLETRPLKGVNKYVYETALFKKDREEIEIDSVETYETYILCRLLMKEKVILPWHKHLDVYTGPLVDTCYDGNMPVATLFSLLMKGETDSKMSLFAALLSKGCWQDLIELEMPDREDVYINHQKDMLSIHLDNHSIIAKGSMDLKACGDHIDIILDEFEEFELFFSDVEGTKILVGKDKATAFYPADIITLETPNKSITLKFITKFNFFGHIMKGNRYNQIVDCNKNFSLFDHKILLRITS